MGRAPTEDNATPKADDALPCVHLRAGVRVLEVIGQVVGVGG